MLFVLAGLSARDQLDLHDVRLAWSILEAGSQRCPEHLGISGIRYSLLPPLRQYIDAMEVLSVDPTEAMHAPSVHSRVRIRHLPFHSPFTPSESRSENYNGRGMWWYQDP